MRSWVRVPSQGKRVLDVGSNAGYDPFMFHLLGATEVVACEPFEFIAQAHFLESVYRSGVRFEQIGWQQLDPDVHGTFDVVHCNGVLYHEPNPLRLLQQLRTMVAEGGELLLGSMMLADAELSEYARFVRGAYAEDPTWWWVPGRFALRWMMDACGFDTELLPVRFAGPMGDLASSTATFAAVRPILIRSSSADTRPRGTANRFPIGHYYSPMYDTRELATRRELLWPATPRETVGINWREDDQLELCQCLRPPDEARVHRRSERRSNGISRAQ